MPTLFKKRSLKQTEHDRHDHTQVVSKTRRQNKYTVNLTEEEESEHSDWD